MDFNFLYKKFLSPLTRFVFKKIGSDVNAADEVISATMIAAWRGYKKFKHKSTFFTWLCRIALNKIADYWRDQINTRSRFIVPTLKAISRLEARDISPIERIALNELRDKVNDCLNLLPYEKGKLLWFRYWKDYSYNQIAKIMRISERAVEGKLYRAKSEFSLIWRLNRQDKY